MSDVTWNPAGDDDTSFGPLTAHNVLGGRTAADAHPATAVSYDNDVSGLTGDTVQEAIDELATSGGAVTSVNGETGVVVLDAGDVGAVPTARTITAGTGLTGGGDLSADRTLTVTYGTTAGTAAAGDDARLSDARPPTAHEASHHHDGSDPLDAGDVGAVPNDAVGLLPGETNRGTWDVAETYAVGDVVFETGSDLYIATAPSTGDQPSLTPGSWDVLDPTGRHVRLGPGATSGDYGTAVGLGATSGDYGTAVGLSATSGDYGTAVGLSATSGDYGTAVGPGATAGDYEVNVANTYRATLDPGDPATPLTATIATGHVDLPETADVTNPPADHQRLVARTDGLYVRDETGAEVGPLGAGTDRLPFHHEQTIFTPTLGSGTDAVSYGTPGERFASNGHGMSGPGVEAWTPVWLDAGVYDKIGVRLTTAAASTWRLGVDAHDTTGQFRPATGPGSNLLDAGTVNMNTAPGWKILGCSLTIASSGIYWLRVLCTAFTAYPHAWSFLGYQSAAWMEFVTAGLTIDSYNPYGRVGWRSISGGTGGFLTTDHFYSMASIAPVVMLGRSA